jgi:hypothetical protein
MNRAGALLELDGDFGPASQRALRACQEDAGLPATGVADAPTWAWLEAQPEPSPDLSCEQVTFIVREEVGSRAYYTRHAAKPHFPGAESGITIGLGYDLRFQTPETFEADWAQALSAEVLAALRPFLGRKGRAADVAALASIEVPFRAAWRVFTGKTLPDFVGRTKRAFPTFDGLSDPCKGVLVSLIYNRGTSMRGASRREMRAIRDHLAAGALAAVAAELESMKRLWPAGSGLRDRRDREAARWRRGLREAVED